MPQLRSIALFALFFFLEVSYPRVAAAASPQSSPHVAASNEPVITKATPAPAKPVPPPKPPCSAGPIELHLLAPGDSQGLANLLNTIFTDVKIEPGMKAGNKASGANAAGAENSSAPTPDGTLCVKNGATGKYLKPSDPKLDPQGRAAAVQKVVRQLDTEAFKGNKLNSNFIVHLPNPDPAHSNSFVSNLTTYFAYPTANFHIQPATGDYFLLIPVPGAAEQAAKIGEDLSTQAGLVKRDLEQLDQLYRDAYSDTAFGREVHSGLMLDYSTLSRQQRDDCLAVGANLKVPVGRVGS